MKVKLWGTRGSIAAPGPGTIIDLPARPGEWVAAGSILARIADLSSLVVSSPVNGVKCTASVTPNASAVIDPGSFTPTTNNDQNGGDVGLAFQVGRDGVEERKARDMRGPDLLQLGYERSLHGRGRGFPGVPVGPVRRQVLELVAEHDHHALPLAGRTGPDLARAQLGKAGPRHAGLAGRTGCGLGGWTGCPAGGGHRRDAESRRTEQRNSLTGD